MDDHFCCLEILVDLLPQNWIPVTLLGIETPDISSQKELWRAWRGRSQLVHHRWTRDAVKPAGTVPPLQGSHNSDTKGSPPFSRILTMLFALDVNHCFVFPWMSWFAHERFRAKVKLQINYHSNWACLPQVRVHVHLRRTVVGMIT